MSLDESFSNLEKLFNQEKAERQWRRDYYQQKTLEGFKEDTGRFIDMPSFNLKIQETFISYSDVVPNLYRINGLGEVYKVRKNGLNYPKALSVHYQMPVNIGNFLQPPQYILVNSFGYVEIASIYPSKKDPKKPKKLKMFLPYLVANIFVNNPMPNNYRAIKFKDGNINNCRADNLVWSAQFDLLTLPEYNKRDLTNRLIKKIKQGGSNSTDLLIDYFSINPLYTPDDVVASFLNIDLALVSDFKKNCPYLV